jgi:hypothetical protein
MLVRTITAAALARRRVRVSLVHGPDVAGAAPPRPRPSAFRTGALVPFLRHASLSPATRPRDSSTPEGRRPTRRSPFPRIILHA